MATPSVKQLNDLNGYAFRYVCAELLTKYGYRDVRVISLRDDNGADLLAQDSTGSWVVCCMNHRRQDGVSGVQRAKAYYKADHAMLITTAKFSPGLLQRGRRLGITMVGSTQLDDILRHTYKSNYDFNADINTGVQRLYDDAKRQQYSSVLSTQWGTLPGLETLPLPASPWEEKLQFFEKRAMLRRTARAEKKAKRAKSKGEAHSPGIALLLILIVFTAAVIYLAVQYAAMPEEVPEETPVITEAPVELTPEPEPEEETKEVKLYDVSSRYISQYGYDVSTNSIIVSFTERCSVKGTWRILDVSFEEWNTLNNQIHPDDYFWNTIWHHTHEKIS